MHVGCFTIPEHFQKEYNGDTANYDFLTNQVIDNTTESSTLSDDEDELFRTVSEKMGSDLDSPNKDINANKKGTKASTPSKKKRKAKSTAGSCKKAKA